MWVVPVVVQNLRKKRLANVNRVSKWYLCDPLWISNQRKNILIYLLVRSERRLSAHLVSHRRVKNNYAWKIFLRKKFGQFSLYLRSIFAPAIRWKCARSQQVDGRIHYSHFSLLYCCTYHIESYSTLYQLHNTNYCTCQWGLPCVGHSFRRFDRRQGRKVTYPYSSARVSTYLLSRTRVFRHVFTPGSLIFAWKVKKTITPRTASEQFVNISYAYRIPLTLRVPHGTRH